MMTAQLQDTDREAFEAEKVLEQDYFDTAKLAYEKRIQARESATVSGNTYERSAQSAALLGGKRLEQTEAVATARMDLEEGRPVYLGSVVILDEDYDLLVSPWQSDIGNRFYEATLENPNGVARKRVFTTTFNRIDSFNDVVFQELPADIAGDTFVGQEDPLLQDLGRGRGEYMADIVRTITADQNRIIRAPKDQLLLIQGGPGTGKTAVALHRVSWILHNFQEELRPKDVLVVGPNPTFTKYIRRVLPTLGDVDVVQQSLAQLLAGDFARRGNESPDVARKKGSAKMETIVQKGLNNRIRIPIGGLEVRRADSMTVPIMTDEIERTLAGIGQGPYSRRRGEFKAALLTVAAGRILTGRLDPVSLIDQTSLEEQVDRVWPQLSPQQFVRELYASKDRLSRAGATDPEVELLYRNPTAKIGDEPWTMADLGIIDCAADAIRGTSIRYEHIVVDEAQDLSYMQLRALRRRSQSGSMTVVGDIAQATSAYARKDWNQVLTTLGQDGKFTEAELTIGYRVPAPALAVASKVLETAAPGLTPPQAFPRNVEEEPRWHIASADEMMNAVVSAVKEHSSRGLFVGVVVADAQMVAVQTAFEEAGIKWSASAEGGLSQGINLVSPEESKGLEFDAVVVVEPKAILDLAQGAKLLYVALTRTVHYLDVVLRADRIPEVLLDFIPCDTVPGRDAGGEQPEDEDNEESATDGGKRSDEGEPTDVSASRDALKPMLERMAQNMAREFFDDVLREVSPNVQHRVVDILRDKVEAGSPGA